MHALKAGLQLLGHAQEIIAFSNPNTRQQYEIPKTSMNARSEKAVPLKNTEFYKTRY